MHPFNSKHLSFAFIPSNVYIASPHYAIMYESYKIFGALQSRVHETWARFFASSLEDRLRYTASDCFETFPLPEDEQHVAALELVAKSYYDHRAQAMASRAEGLTKIYNRFHARGENAPDIARLRTLHAEMDATVLRAYGWSDLADRAASQFIEQDDDETKTSKARLDWVAEFKDEVLARLLALNAERAAAERAAGLTVAPEEDEAKFEEDG
jgi:hypothetical protein